GAVVRSDDPRREGGPVAPRAAASRRAVRPRDPPPELVVERSRGVLRADPAPDRLRQRRARRAAHGGAAREALRAAAADAHGALLPRALPSGGLPRRAHGHAPRAAARPRV